MASSGNAVAKGSVLLTPKFTGLKNAITGQLGSALGSVSGAKYGGKLATGFSSGFAAKVGAIGGVVSAAATAAFGAIGDSLNTAIARVDTLNDYPKVMKNLGYSTDDATASINKMSSAIDGLPTSLDSLTSMTQQIAPMCDSLDEATNISIAFNDALLAGGASQEDVNRALQQYTQILSKGKPDMQDWKTLQEVMPGQLNQIAQALLGPTANSRDLYSALKDGTVAMDDFNQAIEKLDKEGVNGFSSFHDQAVDATAGIGTAMENVKNRISKSIASIIDAIGQANISGAINSFSSQFSKISDVVVAGITGFKQELANTSFGDSIQSIASQIQPINVSIDGIKSNASGIGAAFADGMAEFAGALDSSGFADKVNAIVDSAGQIGDAFQGGFQTFTDGLNQATGGADLFKGAIDGAAQVVTDFTGGIAQIGQGIADEINNSEFVQAALANLGQAFGDLSNTLTPFYNDVLVPLGNVIFPAIGNALGAVVGVLALVAATVLDVINVVVQVISFIVTGVITAVTTIGSIITSAVTFIASIPAQIIGFFSSIGTQIAAFFKFGVNLVKGLFSVLVNHISEIPDKIIGFFSNIGNGIGDFFRDAKDTVTGIFDDLVNFVGGIPDKIIEFFTGIGDRITDAIGSISFPSPHVSWEDLQIGDLTVGLPHVEWYAHGGIVSGATLIGAGERGTELIWPSYGRYMDVYANAITERMDTGKSDGLILSELRDIRRDLSNLKMSVSGEDLTIAVASGVARTARMYGA